MEIMSWWNNVICQKNFIEKKYIECDHLTNSNDNDHWSWFK
jgi:hypothetical protein